VYPFRIRGLAIASLSSVIAWLSLILSLGMSVRAIAESWLEHAMQTPSRPVSQVGTLLSLETPPREIEDVYALIRSVPLGEKALFLFQQKVAAGKIRIIPFAPKTKEMADQEPARFDPSPKDGPALYYDPRIERGELALVLFHEILHSLDPALTSPRCDRKLQEAKRTPLLAEMNRLLEGTGIRLDGEVFVGSDGTDLISTPTVSSLAEIDTSKVPETKFLALKAEFLKRYETARRDAMLCVYHAETLAYRGQWKLTEALLSKYPSYRQYLEITDEKWLKQIGPKYIPLSRPRSEDVIIRRENLSPDLIRQYHRDRRLQIEFPSHLDSFPLTLD